MSNFGQLFFGILLIICGAYILPFQVLVTTIGFLIVVTGIIVCITSQAEKSNKQVTTDNLEEHEEE